MGWPIATDFQEAVQNPKICFGDADLQQGRPKEDRLGLPVPITGAFASVYQMNTPTGRWAVRCFLTELKDQRKRYAAISSHLHGSRLKYSVGFDFLEQGIKVKGQWYPILKMEWIDGEPLDVFVTKNLNQAQRLLQLTRDWIEMMNALKAAQIAHGDLQHGNVIVTPEGLRLIDYDGMYVPALAGLHSNENGHRNYQHPARTGKDFGLYLDNFSAWAVFCSISAVAIDPRLWQILDGGDDCLLFKGEDFKHPDRSRVFQFLQRSRPEVRAIADHFRSLLPTPINQFPALDGRIVPQEHTTRSAAVATNTAIPDWLSDHVATRTERPSELEQSVAMDPTPPAFANADWIVEHLVDQQTPLAALPNHSFVAERAAVCSLIVIVVSLCMASVNGAVSTVVGAVGVSAASGAVILLFLVRYRSATHDKERQVTSKKLTVQQSWLKVLLAQVEAERGKRGEAGASLKSLELRFRRVHEMMTTELRAVQDGRRNFQIAFAGEKQTLEMDEIKALRDDEQQSQRKSSTVQAELNSLDQTERSELSKAATARRDAHIRNFLFNASIHSAMLPRVGPKLKNRLESLGIRCAANIEYSRIIRVEGVGPVTAQNLMVWRNQVEALATNSVPAFPFSETEAIRNKFLSRRNELTRWLQLYGQHERSRRDEILQVYQERRLAYEGQERQALANFDQSERKIRAKYQPELQRIDAAHRLQKAELLPVFKEFDGRIGDLNRQVTEQRFEACKLERQLDRYSRLSWVRYLARTIGTGRAA